MWSGFPCHSTCDKFSQVSDNVCVLCGCCQKIKISDGKKCENIKRFSEINPLTPRSD